MIPTRRPLGRRPLHSLLRHFPAPPPVEPAAPTSRKAPPPPPPPPTDAAGFFSSLLDLRSAVRVATALNAVPAELPQGPIADSLRTRAIAVQEALIEGTQQILDVVRTVQLKDAPRAMPLTAASILGTLRATGALDDPRGPALDRALRTLWHPYVGAANDQAARAQREIDVLIDGASSALCSLDPRLAALVSIDAAINEVSRAKVEALLDLPLERIGDRFADALIAAIESLEPPAEGASYAPSQLDSWVAPGAFYFTHLALAEEALVARVAHMAARPRALADAVSALLVAPTSLPMAAE